MVAYSVIQELLEELNSSDRTLPLNAIIIKTISHYIYCASDMPTTLVDLTTTVINQITLSKNIICMELIPLLLKALYHCSYLSPDTRLGGENERSLYSEIDYIYDKVIPIFGDVENSIDFMMEKWPYQRYICTLLAEVQYYYFKGEVLLLNLPLGLHAFIMKIFTVFLSSSNRKQNRIGIFLLSALLLLDIKEHSPNLAEDLQIPLQQVQWKKGAKLEGVEQNDHSNTLKMDEEKCILEYYFMDIQNVCVAFFEDDDVSIRVSVKKKIEEQTGVFEMFTALCDYLLDPNTTSCYSLQQWIDQLTNEDLSKKNMTDLSSVVKEIRSTHCQKGGLGVILEWEKKIKEQDE